MRAVVVRPWWFVAGRGSLALVFALTSVLMPAGLAGLVALFGAYALLEGATQLVLARASYHASQRWLARAIEGGLGLAAGLVAVFATAMAPGSFTLLVALWALGRGAASFTEVVLTRAPGGPWPLPTGLFSLGFGLWLLAFPGEGGMAGALWIGGFAVSGGVAMLTGAIRAARSGQRDVRLPIIVPTASQLLRAVPIRWRTRLRLPAPR